MSTDMAALGRRFLAASEAFDVEALLALCGADVVCWTTVGPEQDRAALEGRIRLEREHLLDHRLEDARISPTPDGFVLRCVTTGRTPAGDALRIPACIVVEVREGLIHRIEEYVNAEPAKPLLRSMFARPSASSRD